jgi:hypothetical protein
MSEAGDTVIATSLEMAEGSLSGRRIKQDPPLGLGPTVGDPAKRHIGSHIKQPTSDGNGQLGTEYKQEAVQSSRDKVLKMIDSLKPDEERVLAEETKLEDLYEGLREKSREVGWGGRNFPEDVKSAMHYIQKAPELLERYVENAKERMAQETEALTPEITDLCAKTGFLPIEIDNLRTQMEYLRQGAFDMFGEQEFVDKLTNTLRIPGSETDPLSDQQLLTIIIVNSITDTYGDRQMFPGRDIHDYFPTTSEMRIALEYFWRHGNLDGIKKEYSENQETKPLRQKSYVIKKILEDITKGKKFTTDEVVKRPKFPQAVLDDADIYKERFLDEWNARMSQEKPSESP